MEYVIRKARKEDVPQIKKLIDALAHYEKAPHEVTITEAQLVHDGFGEQPVYQCRVADHQGELIGFALFYIGYSTWKGKLIYLDDFYVQPQWRHLGVGTKLMNEVIQYAREVNAYQVRWAVLEWNELAIRFYKKYPVEFDREWIFCRLNRQQILDFCNT